MDDIYFKQALHSMVSNVAYGDAVRHLYGSGLSVEEIQKKLDFPTSIANIETVIREYEKKKASGELEYEYVQQQDGFGRKSFIKVKKN